MSRRCWIAALVMIALGVPAYRATAQAKPVDRTALAQLLADPVKNHDAIGDAVTRDPEASAQVLTDVWRTISDPDAKKSLLTLFAVPANPHLLDILDIGMTDTSGYVQDLASDILRGYTFRDFRWDGDGYKKWKRQLPDKPEPAEEIIKAGGRAIVLDLASSKETWRQPGWLETLSKVDFTGTTPEGKLRRQTVVTAGLAELLTRWISEPLPWNQDQVQRNFHALDVIRNLGTTEDYARKYIVPLAGPEYPTEVRASAVGALATLQKPWVSDLLVKMLPDVYPDDLWRAVAVALGINGDPHCIPTLIALLNVDDTLDAAQTVGEALKPMTQIYVGSDHDDSFWHQWWNKNKTRYPEDVQALAFPRLILKPRPDLAGYLIRRKRERREVGDDPEKSYWLVCPGYFGGFKNDLQPAAVPASELARVSTLGLLVVLVGEDGNGERQAEFWMQAAQKALANNYLIALAVAPKWDPKQPVTWVTETDRSLTPRAGFTTESFAADIVKDVEARYPVNPNKVFLHGVAEGGMAAYACSLAPDTPFKGFYILASTFKSSQLPPLTHADHRRYCIAHSVEDKVAPYWAASAAGQLLKKQGADVKFLPYEGDHGYKFKGDAFSAIGQAISWLELGK